MNYKKLIILLLVITFPLLGFSQSNPKNGKIILSNGEVLEGEILQPKKTDSLYLKCLFRSTPESKIKSYTPGELSGFEITDGRRFKTISIGKPVFMEVISEGKVSLYMFEDKNGTRHFLYSQEFGLCELIVKEQEIKVTGNMNAGRAGITSDYATYTKHTSNTHLKLLKKYFHDKPEMFKVIYDNPSNYTDNYAKLVNKYNQLSSGETGITFRKRGGKGVQFEVSAYAGLAYCYNQYFLVNIWDSFGKSQNSETAIYGVDVNIFFPNTSDRFFLKTGLSSWNAPTYCPSIKIPLQLGYRLPLGRISPEVSLGGNIWLPYAFSVGAQAGAHIKINKNVGFRINFGADFVSEFFIIPGRLLTTSATAGISYKF